MQKPLTANMEMYLKTIYEIVDEGSEPRVKAIADRLGVKMPSVTGALETLRGRGLVSHDRYGDVRLTARGRRTAQDVKHRNDLLHRFMLDVLKLEPEIAARDACVLEHVVSPVTLERLAAFLEFVRVCRGGAGEAISHFHDWLGSQDSGDVCGGCVKHGGTRCS